MSNMENMPSLTCFNCNNSLLERAKFCGSCRTQVRCKECAAELEKGSDICIECGTEILALTNTVKDGHFNTISIRETETERNIEAKFSNEVGKDLTGILRDAMMGNKNVIGSAKVNPMTSNGIEDTDFQELPKETNSSAYILPEKEFSSKYIPTKTEYPAIINISMRALPTSETEWVLVYSFYASQFGTTIFTRRDVISKYDESNRRNLDRLNALTTNFKTLIRSGKLSALTNGYSILDPGMNLAKEIISRTKSSVLQTKARKVKETNPEGEESDNSSGGKKGVVNTTRSKRLNDIDFHPEGKESLENFFKKYSSKNDYERILLFVYYMREVIEIDVISYNHIFTCFETLDMKTPLNVAQVTRNSASAKGWIDLSDSKIELTTNGRNQIRKWNDNVK